MSTCNDINNYIHAGPDCSHQFSFYTDLDAALKIREDGQVGFSGSLAPVRFVYSNDPFKSVTLGAWVSPGFEVTTNDLSAAFITRVGVGSNLGDGSSFYTPWLSAYGLVGVDLTKGDAIYGAGLEFATPTRPFLPLPGIFAEWQRGEGDNGNPVDTFRVGFRWSYGFFGLL